MRAKLDTYENKFFVGAFIRFFRANFGILLGFLILFTVLSFTADNFFTYDNFLNVMRTVSTNGLLAIGVMMAIMLGGIDLTGGALIALSGVITVVSMQRFGLPIFVACVLGVIIGTVAGLINGAIIAYTGIHPFVVTLAMQSICRGSAYLLANGQPVAIQNDEFTMIGNGYLNIFGLSLPLPAVYLLVFLLLAYLLMNKTKTGRHIYAVGGNATSARFSGINIKKIKILVWTISGTLAAFAGVVLSARMSSGQPAVQQGAETDAIAAAVLGGTSMYGGQGNVGGMFIGVLTIGIISNGLTLLRVNSYWQYVAKGVIILIAVYIDMYKKNRESARKE